MCFVFANLSNICLRVVRCELTGRDPCFARNTGRALSILVWLTASIHEHKKTVPLSIYVWRAVGLVTARTRRAVAGELDCGRPEDRPETKEPRTGFQVGGGLYSSFLIYGCFLYTLFYCSFGQNISPISPVPKQMPRMPNQSFCTRSNHAHAIAALCRYCIGKSVCS